jgi:hypothetical protein
MKKILKFLKNWFEHNGLIKIIVTFLILIFAVVIGRNYPKTETICTWIAIISGGYLVLTIAIFTIVGIANGIKSSIGKKKE